MTEFWEHRYFNTYYYSNIIDNILTGDIELLGFISEFFNANYNFLKPFEKYSAFHQFIEFIIFQFIHEDMYAHDEEVFKFYQTQGTLPDLYLEKLFREYSVAEECRNFESEEASIIYEHIEEYHDTVIESGYVAEVCEKVAHEIFYILFNNRKLLIRFNQIVAQHVLDLEESDFDDDNEIFMKYFKKMGLLERVSISEWVKETVFFRDKGHCCLCGTDLTALLRTSNKRHFDHMVPLHLGGINDVTNIQLLCSECNLKKGHRRIETSGLYSKWY